MKEVFFLTAKCIIYISIVRINTSGTRPTMVRLVHLVPTQTKLQNAIPPQNYLAKVNNIDD
jgi:hypothetical protein